MSRTTTIPKTVSLVANINVFSAGIYAINSYSNKLIYDGKSNDEIQDKIKRALDDLHYLQEEFNGDNDIQIQVYRSKQVPGDLYFENRPVLNDVLNYIEDLNPLVPVDSVIILISEMLRGDI